MNGQDDAESALTPSRLEQISNGPAPEESRKKASAMCQDAWEHLDGISKAVEVEISISQCVKIMVALTALRLAYLQLVGGEMKNVD